MALTVDVRLRYQDFDLEVAQDFSLTGVTGLFGPSGSGKSTLLRSIGINLVLAQAGAPVCAAAFRTPPVRVGAASVIGRRATRRR